MARYRTALQNPHVDIIAHPSGRKIGIRDDLDLDWDALLPSWRPRRGTLLEVNGSDERLDLDDRRIRAALDAGCRFTIDSDAHYRHEWDNLSGASAWRGAAGSRRATSSTRDRARPSSHGWPATATSERLDSA